MVVIPDKASPSVPTRPVLRVKGIVALSGTEGMVMTHSAISSISTVRNNSASPMHSTVSKFSDHANIPIESWSISFWLRLLEGPTGNYRSLFYKGQTAVPGDSTPVQRTPSAWLQPNSNRLVLRASTVRNPDEGASSTVDLPTNQWVLLTFVFHNHSHTYPITPQMTLQSDDSNNTSTASNNSSYSTNTTATKSHSSAPSLPSSQESSEVINTEGSQQTLQSMEEATNKANKATDHDAVVSTTLIGADKGNVVEVVDAATMRSKKEAKERGNFKCCRFQNVFLIVC